MMHFPDFRPGHYMFPIHHKTIFLLDHTPYFGISSDVHLELNPSKPRSGMIPLRPISKSLWTCSVEAAIEYSRVVWDLFSEGKLIRFVVSDTQGRVLNSWATEQQNIYRVLGSLSGVGAPPKLTAATTSVDYSIVKGFRAAIEAVCECTEMQNCSRTILTDRPEDVKIPNRCRIICITSALDDESIRNLENMFWNELQAVNKSVEDSNHLIPITQCHLLIMNTYPNGTDPAVNNHPTKELSSMLTSEVIKCPAYDYLCHELLRLLLQHYDLASTTITGIPMKEEQNANSSANYDVEVFHSREAHHSILNGGLVDLKRIRSTKKEGNYPTITLKWSTPRGPVPDVKSCTTLHRITPVNINSRPSACLVTFLLNGRTVLLESGCSDESKIMSHMLTSYGGELFIQSIHVSRNNCNGLALLANSKSKGSAVSDYRKQEFKSLMTAFELKPMKSIYMEESSKKPNTKHPYQQAVNSVKRETKFWPYTVSSNIIFNVLEYTEPLLSLFRKYQLTQEEVYRCKLCICNLAYLDAKKREPFPLPNLCIKGEKITRRDEQFKLLWDELSQYMKAFGKSATHKDVIACVADFRSKSENALIFEKLNMEQALGEVERDKVQLLQRGTVIHTTDTPLSPTEVLLQSSESSSDSDDESEKKLYNGIHSFGEIWLRTRVEKDCLVDLPPYKRLTNAKPNEDGTGFISRLYPNLSSDSDENESETEKHGKRKKKAVTPVEM